MKKVKDLKVGDKVYPYLYYIRQDGGYVVTSIKKQKTLAIVTLSCNEKREIICYGHVSGELLTHNGTSMISNVPFVCDYNRIMEKKLKESTDFDVKRLGYAVKSVLNAIDNLR